MARYGPYIAELRAVRCYRGIEMAAICLVSSLQAARYGNRLVCSISLALVAVVLMALAALVLWRRPMAVLFEQRCTVASLLCQAVAAVLMLANTQLQEPALEVACLAVITSMVGTAVAMLQAIAASVIGGAHAI